MCLFFPFLEKGRSAVVKKQKKEKLFFSSSVPFKRSFPFFAVLAIRFMVCQKSAMHEKLPPHASTSTCFQPLSLSVSQWAKLQSEPESCVLPSRETCLMRTDKRPVSRSPNRRHGSLGRRHQTWFSSKGKSHTNTQARQSGRQ